MTRAVWGSRLAVVMFSTVACTDADWTFRPLDAAVATDRGANGDGPRTDVPVRPTDGAVDAGLRDGTVIDTGGADAGVAEGGIDDVPVVGSDVTLPDAGGPVTGLVLRSQGIATVAPSGASSGTLTLSETGFEMGARGCTGTLCVVGGLVP